MTSIHASHSADFQCSPQTDAPALPKGLLGWVLRFAEWRLRAQTRAQLAQLEPHQIADIGLDEAAVREELAKPFWL